MSLRKKKSDRVILVNGRYFRCQEKTPKQAADIQFIVVPDEPGHKGRPLKVRFDAPKNSVLLDVPSLVSRVMLRRAIKRALARGWDPDAIGGIYEL